MTSKELAALSCREYAETMHPSWGAFQDRREPFYLYLHAGSRIKCQYQQHSEMGFGFDRDDAQGAHMIDGAQADAKELAADIVQGLCEFLSIRQLEMIIPAMQKMHDDWKASRQKYITSSKG